MRASLFRPSYVALSVDALVRGIVRVMEFKKRVSAMLSGSRDYGEWYGCRELLHSMRYHDVRCALHHQSCCATSVPFPTSDSRRPPRR